MKNQAMSFKDRSKTPTHVSKQVTDIYQGMSSIYNQMQTDAWKCMEILGHVKNINKKRVYIIQ